MPALVQAVLPVGVRGIVMAAMVSIMMSAADGFLNGAAIGLVCDTLLPLRPEMSDRAQLRWLRGVNLATGLGAMALAFIVPDVFQILVLAYSFWAPLILVPLAAAFLGIRSSGRRSAMRCSPGWRPPSFGIMRSASRGRSTGRWSGCCATYACSSAAPAG